MTIKSVFVLLFAAILSVFGTSASAGWELYDDFNSGVIDNQKWLIDESSATLGVEKGQAKFVHQSGYPDDSSYLIFNQAPGNILGIRAKVFIESCSGDVTTRIAAFNGKISPNHILSMLQLKPSSQSIYTITGLRGPAPSYNFVQELQYATFTNPIPVTGVSFNLTMVFSSDKITYEVDGLGKITYKYATPIAAADNLFRAIGTGSLNGDGPCTVYFDNVYVLRP